MPLDRLTEDELAAFVAKSGMRVQRCNGIWWIEPRPFFFRPLLPFAEIAPDPRLYPVRSRLFGVQHAVSKPQTANSLKDYFVFENPQKYDLAFLSHPRANKIRKGLKLFEWKRIDDPDHFTADGFRVYADFERRTRYGFMRNRKKPHNFARWARTLFAYPKIAVSGAYQEGRLCAVSIYYLVDNLFVNATYFSDSESQRYQVHDFVLHHLRLEASETDAGMLYMGPRTGVPGIDRAKITRGCTLVTKRMHVQLNPLADLFLRTVTPRTYARLFGQQTPS